MIDRVVVTKDDEAPERRFLETPGKPPRATQVSRVAYIAAKSSR